MGIPVGLRPPHQRQSGTCPTTERSTRRSLSALVKTEMRRAARKREMFLNFRPKSDRKKEKKNKVADGEDRRDRKGAKDVDAAAKGADTHAYFVNAYKKRYEERAERAKADEDQRRKDEEDIARKKEEKAAKQMRKEEEAEERKRQGLKK